MNESSRILISSLLLDIAWLQQVKEKTLDDKTGKKELIFKYCNLDLNLPKFSCKKFSEMKHLFETSTSANVCFSGEKKKIIIKKLRYLSYGKWIAFTCLV